MLTDSDHDNLLLPNKLTTGPEIKQEPECEFIDSQCIIFCVCDMVLRKQHISREELSALRLLLVKVVLFCE